MPEKTPPEFTYTPLTGPYQFSCLQCGKCCTIRMLSLTPYDVWEACQHDIHMELAPSHFTSQYCIIDLNQATPQVFLQGINDKCPFLKMDDKGQSECLIYTHRFHICRTYPIKQEVKFKAAKQQQISRTPKSITYSISRKCDGVGIGSSTSIRPEGIFQSIDAKETLEYQYLLSVFSRVGLFNIPIVKEAWFALFYNPDLQGFYNIEMTWNDYKKIVKEKLVEIYEEETNQKWEEIP